MKKKLILFAALCALVVTGVIFYGDQIAQAVVCNGYTSSSTPVPTGYGAWYDVFSPSVLLLNVDCAVATTFTVGKGSSSQIVYEKGWKWHASANQWKEIVFTGATRYKDASGNPLPWFVGSANTIIPSAIKDAGTNYVVGFVCTNQAGTWKCGCSDTACTEGKWQLQAFEVAAPPPPEFSCDKWSELKKGEVITLPSANIGGYYCVGLPKVHKTGSVGGCGDSIGLKNGTLPKNVRIEKPTSGTDNSPWTLKGWLAEAGTFKFTLQQNKGITEYDGSTIIGCKYETGWIQDYSLTVNPDVIAPTVPTGLSATVVSSQINLSWTASTDNVGVTGYRVERCQGSTCTNFAQIGTPTTNSYSDTGLSADTTYRYQVRAIDKAGNLSAYSTIFSSITPSSGPTSIDFEAWNTDSCFLTSTGGLPVNPGCFSEMACGNGRAIHTRRVHGGAQCAVYSSQVLQWSLGLNTDHGNYSDHGARVAIQIPEHVSGNNGSGLLEMMTSRTLFPGAGTDASTDGFLQADYFIHGPNISRGSPEHHFLIHNVQLQPLSCTKDCAEDSTTGTNRGDNGFPNFYGVIFGSFGNSSLAGESGCASDGSKCLGFVVEKRVGDGQVSLLPATFLPYSKAGGFPANEWIRIRITWDKSSRVYTYDVWIQSSTGWEWLGKRTYSAASWSELPSGYVSVGAGFFDSARGRDRVHMDIDNVIIK